MPKSITTHHEFTTIIEGILRQHFGEDSQAVLDGSPLLSYLNIKTRSATRGSKARGSFANLYALYVIISDYINTGHYGGENRGRYSEYEGARFSDLLLAQRTLPFGSKLQNHGLNSRMNQEFKRYYPTLEKLPIIRNLENQRYWIHEDFLNVVVRNGKRKTCGSQHCAGCD